MPNVYQKGDTLYIEGSSSYVVTLDMESGNWLIAEYKGVVANDPMEQSGTVLTLQDATLVLSDTGNNHSSLEAFIMDSTNGESSLFPSGSSAQISAPPVQVFRISGNAQVDLIGITFDSIVIENNAHVNLSNVTVGKITAGYRSTFIVTDSEIGRIFVGNSASGTVDTDSQVNHAFTKHEGRLELTSIKIGKWKEKEQKPPMLVLTPEYIPEPEFIQVAESFGDDDNDDTSPTHPDPSSEYCEAHDPAGGCQCPCCS